MARKALFKSAARAAPKATSINHEHAPAYELDSRTALAQLAATGCFGNTFYVSGNEQLDEVLEHANKCDPAFIAKVAVYARERGFMKDMPAVLLGHLATRGPEGIAAMKAVFPRVIDNGRMLRSFVQVIRSGQLGRKSLGTAPKSCDHPGAAPVPRIGAAPTLPARPHRKGHPLRKRDAVGSSPSAGSTQQGDTVDDALANAREAIELTIEDMEAAGEPIPDPSGEIVEKVTVGD